jgi:hypothetical protein
VVSRHHRDVCGSAASGNTVARRRAVAVEGRPCRIVVAFVGLAFGVYMSTLRLGFLSDDFVLAARAARNEFLGPAAEFFRPLSLLVYKVGGTRPFALHAFNIVLHGVNSALVVPVALSFGLSPAVAIVAGGPLLTYPGSR